MINSLAQTVVLAQSALEQNIVLGTLACALASIPVALVMSSKARRQASPPPVPALPEEPRALTEEPSGPYTPPPPSVPPPLPLVEETGVPARQWKAADGWAALALTVLLCLMMGPAAMAPAAAGEGAPPEPLSLSAKVLTANFVFQLTLTGIVLFYLSVLRGFSLTELFGLKRLPPLKMLGSGLLWGAAGGFAVLVLTVVLLVPLMKLTGLENPAPQEMVRALEARPLDFSTQMLVFLTAAVGAPLMEEVIFRGFLYSTAKRFTNTGYAAAVTSVLFAVIHANFMSLVPLTLLGLLFVFVYEKTRSLPVVMVMHGLFNFAQLSLLFYGRELVKTS